MIQEMIAILQEDLPYIVLTYDPDLEAYRTDSIGDFERTCPSETGTVWCQQVSYEPIASLEPGGSGGGSDTVSGIPGGLAAIGALLIAVAGFVIGRARGRREIEPLELEA